MDAEMRELLGYPIDGLLRDENGCTIPNVIHHEPPVAAVLRTLEVAFPQEYRPTSNSNINLQGAINTTVGVAIAKPRTKEDGPPRIPPLPPMPQLEAVTEDDELEIPEPTEAMASEPEADVVDTAPIEDAAIVAAPDTLPERVIRNPSPDIYQSAPKPILSPSQNSPRKLSPLELDLLGRSRGSIDARSASPVLPAKTNRART
jgi:hypothetical protein